MKKANHLFTILFALFSTSIIAQNIAGFENLSLPSESYWDGSDLSGQHNNSIFYSSFSSGDYSFSNTYDTTYGAIYGFWSKGWAYSNITDSVTSGYENLYSAKAGGGFFGSQNYVVGTNTSTIVFNQPSYFSAMITNSTYAANSMRDGDMFAKKFTNADQDFFKLTVLGFYSGTLVDSAEFYLADFTHADSTEDYIVNDWQYMIMQNTLYDSVQMKLTSSDVGQFGMNTPAYFCLDNIGGVPTNITENNSIDISVFPNPTSNVVFFENNFGSLIFTATVFDSFGRMVFQPSVSPKSMDVSNLPTGIYYINISSLQGQTIKKLIKR